MEKILVQWKSAAARSHACVLTGDINLDYMRWNLPEAGHVDMVEDTRMEMEPEHFHQIVEGPTHLSMDMWTL